MKRNETLKLEDVRQNLRKRNGNETKLQSWRILDKNLRKRNQNKIKLQSWSILDKNHLRQKPEKEKPKQNEMQLNPKAGAS